MDDQELERLYASGDRAAVSAALAQRASDNAKYWAQGDTAENQMIQEFNPEGATPGAFVTRQLPAAARALTFAYGGYRWAKDELSLTGRDPNFDPIARYDELTKDMPVQYHDDLMDSESYQEYLQKVARIKEDEQDMKTLAAGGLPGTVAMIGGSIFDVDMLLAPLTDGAYTAAKVARVVRNARLAKMASMGLSGAASGAFIEGGNALVRETGDWSTVPQAALMGLAMGGAFGTVVPLRKKLGSMAEETRQAFIKDYADGLLDHDVVDPSGLRYAKDPAEFVKAATERKAQLESAGAAAIPGRGSPREAMNPDLVDSVQQGWVDYANDWIDTDGPRTRKSKWEWVDKADSLLGKFKMGGDSGVLAQSKSAIARWLGSRMLETPGGGQSRVHTAALDRDMYQRRILQGIPEYTSNYNQWARSKGASFMETHYRGDMESEFGKAVHLELNYRRLHDAESPNANQHVKAAADAIEKQAKEAYDIAQGRVGETAVDGFGRDGGTKYKRGYSPLRWDGYKILNLIKAHGKGEGGASRAQIENLVAKGYVKSLGVQEDIARTFAKAVVGRALMKSQDFDTSLQSLLTADGRAFLRDRLIENGIGTKRATDLVDNLAGPLEERGKQSFAKERTEIDLSMSDENGLNLIDLVDNNLTQNWTLYARQMSGAAALARMGISNKAMRKEIIQSMIAEQNSLGEKPTTVEFMNDVFSYFDAGPMGGGLSPTVSRLKKLTNLSMLNKLGLAQAGELGATIAGVGVENFLAHSPIFRRLVKSAKAGNTDPLLNEIGAWTGRMWDEEKLVDPAFDFTSDRLTAQDHSELLHGLDRFLAKGQRLQGHMSAFFAVRRMQMKAATVGMADKLFRMLRDGTDGSEGKRFSDIGFDPGMREKLKALIDDGTIEFQDNGFLDKLNMDKWDPQLAHEFAGGITRFTAQVIQRDLIGESNTWMHKDWGALLSHLRTFPMLAMTKQVIRNVRINDDVSKATLLYGLMTAAAAYTAGRIVEGRTDQLDPIDIAKGAINYSNMTGMLPMMWDPIATMFGADDWRMQKYGPYAQVNMPVLDWVNKAIRAPGAVGKIAMGAEVDKGDMSALKALPFANMYGSALMFDVLAKDE